MASKLIHEKFNKKVAKFMENINAMPGAWYKWQIETSGGLLQVNIHPPEKSVVFSIFTKFDDPQKATTAGFLTEVFEKFNGKYNFHEYDADICFFKFTEFINRVRVPQTQTNDVY